MQQPKENGILTSLFSFHVEYVMLSLEASLGLSLHGSNPKTFPRLLVGEL